MKPILVLFVLALALTAGACLQRDVAAPAEDVFQLRKNSEFDGVNLRFFLPLDDGSQHSVNTTDDLIEERPGTTPIPGHRAKAWTFQKVTEDTSIAHALVSWDPDDPGDYVAFGWWALFPDRKPPELSFEDSVQYALIDGPEIDHGIVPQLPVDGTVSYAGPAGGLYAYTAGSDWGENESGEVLDEWQGTVTLTADFADGSLKGCIGCVGDLVTQRAHFGVFLGDELLDLDGLAKDYELHLATALIRDDGMFERERVTVRHPERSVTRSDGLWGGALSSRQDMDGNPRLVAGFSGVYFEERDGSEGSFFGSFLGLSSTFRETGVSDPLPEKGS